MFKNVYARKRVLITGHMGFTGAWLSAWLLSLGAEVMGFSYDIPTSTSMFSALDLEKHSIHMHGDVRDKEKMHKAIQEFAPQCVFHIARQSCGQSTHEQPLDIFERTAIGTLTVLEVVRQLPCVQALVCIGSDACYAGNEWVYGYREEDPLGGTSIYNASMACTEIMTHAYMHQYFLQNPQGPACAMARAGHVMGGGDFAEGSIIADCANAYSKGEPVHIRMPKAIRAWQHILDPLSGYLWLGANLLLQKHEPHDLRGQAYNFGPASHTAITVAEMVQALGLHWPNFVCTHDEALVTAEITEKYAQGRKLCCDKALAHLQWRAVYDFEESLRATAEWYRAFYHGMQQSKCAEEKSFMLRFTMGQIGAYCTMAEHRELAWVAGE